MPSKRKKQAKLPAQSLKPRKLKIKVVGLGGGGASIVSEVASTLKNASFVIADTDQRAFRKARKPVRVFQFGEKLAGGMGTGMDPDLARKAAELSKDKIAKIFSGQDISILIGSLGGGVCSGAGPVFAEVAKEQKNVSLGIFTLPFSFEGEKKARLAKKALLALQESLSGVIVVPNEKIFQLIDKRAPLKKALSALNQIFADWLSDVISLILRPSLINIDFADLRTILKERGQPLFFSRAEAQGPNRVEEVLKRMFHNLVFEEQPEFVKRILFNITGGKDLKLKEVEAISEAVASLNPRAKIIFGISELPKYKGKIKITLLAVSEDKGKKKEKTAADLSAKKNRKENGEEKSPKQKKDKEKKRKSAPKSKGGKIRRSALEVKKAEKEQEEKEWAQEPEWQIPAFLRDKMKE